MSHMHERSTSFDNDGSREGYLWPRSSLFCSSYESVPSFKQGLLEHRSSRDSELSPHHPEVKSAHNESTAKEMDHYRRQLKALSLHCEALLCERRHLQRQYEEAVQEKEKLRQDYEEIVLLREQEKLDLANSDFGITVPVEPRPLGVPRELQREKYDSLLGKWDELRTNYDTVSSKHNSCQLNLTCLKEHYNTAMNEISQLRKEVSEVKHQQVEMSVDYDDLAKENERLMQGLIRAQLHLDASQRECMSAVDARAKLFRELQKTQEERDLVTTEFRHMMGDRDIVHKEIGRLQDELADANHKLESSSREYGKSIQEIDCLRQEITSTLISRDSAVKESNNLRQRLSDLVKEREGVMRGFEDVRRKYDQVRQDRDVAKCERTEAMNHRDKILRDCFDVKYTFENADKLGQEALFTLQQKFSILSEELAAAWHNAEVYKNRRDFAFSERDKAKQECEVLQRQFEVVLVERNQLLKELVSMPPRVDQLGKRGMSLSANSRSSNQSLDSQGRSLLPFSQTSSSDSAIDSDCKDWEVETFEFQRNKRDSDLGFSLASGYHSLQQSPEFCVFVSDVVVGSPADGKLRLNDCVVKLNNIDLNQVDTTKLSRVIAESENLSITVMRRRPAQFLPKVQIIRLTRTFDSDVGISVGSSNIIQQLTQSCCGGGEYSKLAVGDRILSVNGIYVTSLTPDEVNNLLQTCVTTLTIMKQNGSSRSLVGHVHVYGHEPDKVSRPMSVTNQEPSVMTKHKRSTSSPCRNFPKLPDQDNQDVYGSSSIKPSVCIDHGSVPSAVTTRDHFLNPQSSTTTTTDLSSKPFDQTAVGQRCSFSASSCTANTWAANRDETAGSSDVKPGWVTRGQTYRQSYSAGQQRLMVATTGPTHSKSRQEIPSGFLTSDPYRRNPPPADLGTGLYTEEEPCAEVNPRLRGPRPGYTSSYNGIKRVPELRSFRSAIVAPHSEAVPTRSNHHRYSHPDPTLSMSSGFINRPASLFLHSLAPYDGPCTPQTISEEIHLASSSDSENSLRILVMERGSQQLGFGIVQGSSGGLFVSGLTSKGLAFRAGVCLGDQLLEFNGINLRGANFEQAVAIIRQSSSTVSLLVQSCPEKLRQALDSGARGVEPFIQSPEDSTKQSKISGSSSNKTGVHGRDLPAEIFPAISLIPDRKITPLAEDDTDSGPVRALSILRTLSSLGISIIGGSKVGVFVCDIQSSSFSRCSEGISCGDQILQCNGTSLMGVALEQAARLLIEPVDVLKLRVQFNPIGYQRAIKEPGDSFFVRAMFDYMARTPDEMSFRSGDVLQVTNTLYQGRLGQWFGTLKTGDDGRQESGVFPSTSKVETELSNLLPPLSTSDEKVQPLLGFLRRTRKSSAKDTHDVVGESQPESTIPYLPVVPLDCSLPRPVALVGPLAGVVIEKLCSDFPLLFDRCCTDLIKSGSGTSQKPYRKGMSFDLVTGKKPVLPNSINFQILHDIISKGKHCLLDVTSASVVEKLPSFQLHPIIILIKFKSVKHIREIKDDAHLKGNASAPTAKDLFDFQIRCERDFKYFSPVSVSGSSLAQICSCVQGAVSELQKRTVWVPARTDDTRQQ